MIRAHLFLSVALLSMSIVRAGDGVLQAQIEAQPVADALTTLARQSGLQIIYGADVVRGRQSNGAPAGLSTEEALAKVLEGTGLSFEFLNPRTVTISSAAGGKPTAQNGNSNGKDTRLMQADAAASGQEERAQRN